MIELLKYKTGELQDLCKLLISKMETLQERLNNKEYPLINPLGELQSLGGQIDILCAEVNLLDKIIGQR